MRKRNSFMIGDSVIIRVKKNDSSFSTFKCFIHANFYANFYDDFYDDFYRVNITSKTRHGLVIGDSNFINHLMFKASDCFPTDILLIEKILKND